jgi:hypothetical protein
VPTDPVVLEHPHRWVMSATIPADEKLARYAEFRQSFRVKQGLRIDVLEVYCEACRRPLDDVGDQACSALINNEHLRGGPIGERAKRKPLPDTTGLTVIPGPRIQRRGLEAYVLGGTT